MKPTGSLTQRLFVTLWGLFLLLLVSLTALGYVALRLTAERVVPSVLQHWVQLKAEANQNQLVQADRSVRRLRQTLVQRLDASLGKPDDGRFAALFARSPDGLWRVRPELVDTLNAPTLYLHAGPAGPDAATRARAVASYGLLREQGPALVPPFFSVYMDFVEDGLMVYSRGLDWGANADAKATNANYPTMLGSDPRRNPSRQVFWTPVYLDEQAHTWMVSVIAPLDWQGRWVGTLGHDVTIQALIDSVADNSGTGVEQMVLDTDGDLIAHPQLRERIAAANGHLQIATLGDPALEQVRRLIVGAGGDSGAGRTADGRRWVAWTRIQGPGWLQVDVLAQEKVDHLIMMGGLMVCAIGLLVFGPALWLLRRRVKTLVAQPLRRLTRAADELAQGLTPQPIALDSPDELGRLAAAFDAMAAELAQQREHLTMLAERDVLTGLHNRRYFDNELARFFKESARTGAQGTVLLFDLDEFKYINDSFGHCAGDAMLLRVAGETRALVRGSDTLCRLGGDEFAVFMPNATIDGAQALAERIVRTVGQSLLQVEGQNLRLTTSLGLAHFPDHGQSAEELVSHADMAMYQAKRLGKNRWSVYRPNRDAEQAMAARMAWSERIDAALDRDLLRLHFQGIYRASDGALAHLEALVRMVDEANPGRLVAPGEFIGHAEKSGRILEIDRWVLRTSIALLAAHPRVPALAVNISGRSFDDPDLPEFITGQLSACGVAAERLLIEITETAAISDLRDAERFIGALRQAGCPLCLDDFGSGFASFAYLKQLKVDVLKIDGLFIRNLPNERDNQVFVRSIIEVARGMGQHTVAEFVEDEETLQLLKGFGVDMVQGYFFERPSADHPAFAA